MSKVNGETLVAWYDLIGGTHDGERMPLFASLKTCKPGEGWVKLKGERYVWDEERGAMVFDATDAESVEGKGT